MRSRRLLPILIVAAAALPGCADGACVQAGEVCGAASRFTCMMKGDGVFHPLKDGDVAGIDVTRTCAAAGFTRMGGGATSFTKAP